MEETIENTVFQGGRFSKRMDMKFLAEILSRGQTDNIKCIRERLYVFKKQRIYF